MGCSNFIYVRMNTVSAIYHLGVKKDWNLMTFPKVDFTLVKLNYFHKKLDYRPGHPMPDFYFLEHAKMLFLLTDLSLNQNLSLLNNFLQFFFKVTQIFLYTCVSKYFLYLVTLSTKVYRSIIFYKDISK